jgi:hypothetical protein
VAQAPRVLLIGKKIEPTTTGKATKGSPRSQVVTHFDQCNEQSSTDSGKKDRQNLSCQGSHGRGSFVNEFGFLDILDAGRFR